MSVRWNYGKTIKLVLCIFGAGGIFSFVRIQCSKGCLASESYIAGDITVKDTQERGSNWDCNHSNRYEIQVHNGGMDKEVIKILVNKKTLSFEVASNTTHLVKVPSSPPVIKQLTICKKRPLRETEVS